MPMAAQGGIGDGRYLLIKRLASGGMGTVWEGRDLRLNRTVAIKEVSLDLIPPIQREQFVARAVHEGRNAAALADHPNIVTVYDVVLEHDLPWTVMQFVRGRSLAGVLQAGPMAVDAAAVLAEQMLSALGFAHEVGIVHRDVKPLNIMIDDADGRALLTDFGIAKNSADVSLTQAGVVIGSIAYMAPERHEGESGGAPSDLFSLGVTLFEAVEGYSPFAKETRTGTVTAILVKPLPAMKRAGRLAPLIQALTDKDPDKRPSLARALTLVKNGAPTKRLSTTAIGPGTDSGITVTEPGSVVIRNGAPPGKKRPAALSKRRSAVVSAAATADDRFAAMDKTASPNAREFAAKYGIDLSKVKGSMPGGHIIGQDVLDVVERRSPSLKFKRANLFSLGSRGSWAGGIFCLLSGAVLAAVSVGQHVGTPWALTISAVTGYIGGCLGIGGIWIGRGKSRKRAEGVGSVVGIVWMVVMLSAWCGWW